MGAGLVVADQLDSSGDVEDVFTLSSTETKEILEIIQKYSTESQFIEDGGGTLGAEQVISWRWSSSNSAASVISSK